MHFKNIIVAFGLILGIGTMTACKKEITEKEEEPAPVEKDDPLKEAKVKDSVLMYSRDLYLWYKQIPSNFDPQSHADPNAIMTALRAYSVETGYTSAVDRWSYAIKKTEWDKLSLGLGSTNEDVNKGFGLNVFFRVEGDLRVRHVEKESPAGLSGVRRGWRITKINGSTNINTSNANAIINGVYEATSSSFTFQKPDGSTTDITLNSATYKEQPVVLDSVYTEGTKKVGYLVFNSFLGDTARIFTDLQKVFDRFAQQQVNELIVDLRYNGGGYVKVQERLANYIINSSYNGQVMMSERFNDKYTRFNTTLNFSKLGSVNVNRVSFIVSNSTASASELLINNLKPYMDVRLVGPSKTHGKPVGFFPVGVGDWYIFPVSFKTVNKNGEGSYFNGLPLSNSALDGIDKDWGDRSETALGFILNGLKNGTYRLGTTHISLDPIIEAVNDRLSANDFKGTVDTRRMY